MHFYLRVTLHYDENTTVAFDICYIENDKGVGRKQSNLTCFIYLVFAPGGTIFMCQKNAMRKTQRYFVC